MKDAKLSRRAKWMVMLGVVSLGVFVFSCRQSVEMLHMTAAGAQTSVLLAKGELRLNHAPAPPPWGPTLHAGFNVVHQRNVDGMAVFPWRPYHTASLPGSGYSYDGVAIPLWPVVAVSLIGAGYCLGFRRAARISDRTHCSACGYDLRGLPKPAGGGAGAKPICPECGER